MLKIEEITKGKVPIEVWNKFHGQDIIDAIKECYQSEGMFGIEFDYLLVMEIDENRMPDSIYCYGYVYNGNEPAFSEFGSFGLDKQKTMRVW